MFKSNFAVNYMKPDFLQAGIWLILFSMRPMCEITINLICTSVDSSLEYFCFERPITCCATFFSNNFFLFLGSFVRPSILDSSLAAASTVLLPLETVSSIVSKVSMVKKTQRLKTYERYQRNIEQHDSDHARNHV